MDQIDNLLVLMAFRSVKGRSLGGNRRNRRNQLSKPVANF